MQRSRMSLRLHSHNLATTSGKHTPAVPSRSRRAGVQVFGALFEPPPFQPQKLSVQWLPGARSTGTPPLSRRYTLTHNDITGALLLSIGLEYNQKQVQGFYTRILRDEITAEWLFASGAAAPAELHIYCHVSGEEKWLAPPQLRNFIFRREMTLVLDTFAFADSTFLQAYPELNRAKVYVHFQSDVQDLDLREYWGTLGDRSSWRRMPQGLLARIKLLLFGFPALPHQRPRTSLTTQQQQRQHQQPSGTPSPAAADASAPLRVVAGGGQSQKQQQQQQQWLSPAEAAVEVTRSRAFSLQQQQQQHPPGHLHPACEQPPTGIEQGQQVAAEGLHSSSTAGSSTSGEGSVTNVAGSLSRATGGSCPPPTSTDRITGQQQLLQNSAAAVDGPDALLAVALQNALSSTTTTAVSSKSSSSSSNSSNSSDDVAESDLVAAVASSGLSRAATQCRAEGDLDCWQATGAASGILQPGQAQQPMQQWQQLEQQPCAQQQLEQQEPVELLEDYGCWVLQTSNGGRDEWQHKYEAVNGSSGSSVLVPAVSTTLQAAIQQTQQQQQPLVRALVAAAGPRRARQNGA